MSEPDRGQTLAWLGLASVLFAAVGLVGRVTELTPGGISFGRAVVATAVLGGVLAVRRETLAFRGVLGWAGLLQALNWGLFFASIQVGGLAVAIVSLFTYPILTAVLEPLLFRKPFQWREGVAGLLVLSGVGLVTPEFNLANPTTAGVLLGVGSALFLTVRNLAGKGAMEESSAVQLNFWMCLICIPLFAPLRWADPQPFSWDEAWQVGVLGGLLTVAPQLIFFESLKKVTAAYASLVVSIQPVFAVLMAWLLFGDVPSLRTVLGGLVILGAVIWVTRE